MTEQERRRRRRERERRMRTGVVGKRRERKRGGFMAFRIYVTAVLVGGFLLISQFQTETSIQVCERVKEVITTPISKVEVAEWKEKVLAFLEEKEIVLPAFKKIELQEEKKPYHPDTEP